MRASRLPADSDHPYGHDRFETIGAMIVGVMLMAAAGGVAGHALDAWRAVGGQGQGGLGGLVPHGHVHAVGPGGIALAAAVVSVVSKELLYRATARVGRRIRSPALEANAWHHRSDAMSSVVALVGIAAAKYGGGAFAYADAAAAAAVAVMLGGGKG